MGTRDFIVRSHYYMTQTVYILPDLPSLRTICQKTAKGVIESWHLKLWKADGDFRADVAEFKKYLLPLPVKDRASLLEEFRVMITGYEKEQQGYPLSLFALEVLLSNESTHVAMGFDCGYHQEQFDKILDLLAQEGEALENLKMWNASGSLRYSLRNYRVFGDALLLANNLVELRLDDLCDDDVMKLIGLNCTRLQILIAFGSHVTDEGLQLLTQNILRVNTENNTEDGAWTSKLSLRENIFLPMECLVPAGQRVEAYQRKKSPLCSTLNTLILGDSFSNGITKRGILVVLELVSNIESFGDFDLKDTFEGLRADFTTTDGRLQLPPLTLTSVHVSEAKAESLEVIKLSCPKLKLLQCDKCTPQGDSPLEPLTLFNCFTSLESLSVGKSYSRSTFQNINGLLPDIKSRLTHLTMHNRLADAKFSLEPVVSECQSLRSLSLEFPTFVWQEPSEIQKNLNQSSLQLTSISLLGKISVDTLAILLAYSPRLEDIHVGEIIEKPQVFLERVCGVVELPKLKTFRVSPGYLVDTKEELTLFLSFFPSVELLGRLRFFPILDFSIETNTRSLTNSSDSPPHLQGQ